MGTEKALTRTIMALILGVGRADMKAGLDLKKGTPNHRALAAASGYGWAMEFGDEQQKAKAKAKVNELFDFQNKGHYTWGDTNEALTASHYNWWGVAMASLRWFARKHGDPKVLELADRWWRRAAGALVGALGKARRVHRGAGRPDGVHTGEARERRERFP